MPLPTTITPDVTPGHDPHHEQIHTLYNQIEAVGEGQLLYVSGGQVLAYPRTPVDTTGDQSIAGAKTFLDTVNAKVAHTKDGPVFNAMHPDYVRATDAETLMAAIDAAELANSGVVYLGRRAWDVASTVEYVGTAGNTITIAGAGRAGRGPRGTILRWAGPAGGTTLRMRGGQNMVAEGIAFTAGVNAPLYDLELVSDQPAGGAGLANVRVEDCHFGGAAGADSAFMRIGDSNFQADTVNVASCTMAGNETNPIYGILTATANAKNFAIRNSEIVGCQTAIFHGGSGYYSIDSCGFSRNKVTDVRVGTGQVSIRGCGSEGSTRFVTGTVGTSHGSVAILGSYFDSANVPTDDYVIDFTGALFIVGSKFFNRRLTTAEAKIRSGALAGANASSVVSFGNQYGRSTRFAPIYNGSNFHWKDVLTHAAPLHVLSFADIGGDPGALTQLQSSFADLMYTPGLLLTQNSNLSVQHDTDGAGTMAELLRVIRDNQFSANQCGLFIRVKDGAGVASLRNVSIGAADSGGAGFRTLRVPN